MGTNYYYHVNVCEHCKKSEQSFHIGKNSAGWTFSFRAYDKYNSPFMFSEDVHGQMNVGMIDPIRSFSDWKEIFKSVPGEIRNEYNEVISVEGFIEIVNFKRSEKYNHTQVLIDARNGNTSAQKMWGDSYPFCDLIDTFLDEEGNSFQLVDFC
jgi:hypothetical protein